MADKYNITTISGKRFDPTKPCADDIELYDIAHSLSMMTRANGHFKEFYSVARHSINCAREAEKRGYTSRVCLFCLLHDAAEAYIGDMTRPLKLHFPLFSEYEAVLQSLILKKYAYEDITEGEAELVKKVDDSLMYHEFICYNGDKLYDFTPEIHIDVSENTKGIKETEDEFLKLWEELRK